jgi:hypothetical protein
MATQSNPLIDDSLVDFLLYSVLDAEGLCQLGAYEQHSKETFDLYIDSVRRFARQDMLPTYKPMDEEPPVFRDGRIHTHPALPALFEQMVDLGVLTATCPETVGGQQMPTLVHTMATAYLIELLDERIRTPALDCVPAPTLAGQLLAAQHDSGAVRIRRMRSLGDRALFESGFFGDSLGRKTVDIDYYQRVGRIAYSDVATGLSGPNAGRGWTQLYRELSGRFGDFVDVLAEVGDRSRPRRSPNLPRLYERFLLTGSERDRRQIIQTGHATPSRRSTGSWQ